MMVIVPNEVSEAIHKALEKAAEGLILTVEEYEQHYSTLLNYFDEHGVVPDFRLAKNIKPQPDDPARKAIEETEG